MMEFTRFTETVSQRCRRDHVQACDHCEDTACGDNTRAPRRSLKDEVEAALTKAAVPFVNVDDAKRAMFGGSKLRAFHFVSYRKEGPNWLIWASTAQNKAVREDMVEWAKVFGDGFVVRYARRRKGGLVFVSPDGVEETL